MAMSEQAAIDQEKDFIERLGKVDAHPLWVYHRDGPRSSPPKATPFVWRWKEMRELAIEAGTLERIKGGPYRRALLMQNPGLKAGGMEGPAHRPGFIVEGGFHQPVAVAFHAGAGIQAEPFAARLAVQIEADVGIDAAGVLCHPKLGNAIAKIG